MSGRDGLAVLAQLLQQCRLEHPTYGVWEAADLYWRWRSPRASDELAQPVWLDGDGNPVAPCVFTEWQGSWTCDPIVLPSRDEDLLPVVIAAAGKRLDGGAVTGDVMMAVPDTDERWQRLAAEHDFAASEDQWAVLWMDAGSAPVVSALSARYMMSDRLERAGLPHHFDVKFGMVEPMRTEDAHQGRGLGRSILTTGLARLVAAGAERLKVSVKVGNPPAEHLYNSVGFVPTRIDTGFTRHVG